MEARDRIAQAIDLGPEDFALKPDGLQDENSLIDHAIPVPE